MVNVFGCVPAASVSSSSTLQILRRKPLLWWLLCGSSDSWRTRLFSLCQFYFCGLLLLWQSPKWRWTLCECVGKVGSSQIYTQLFVLWWCLRPWFSSSFLFCGGVSDLGSLQAFCFVVVSQTLVLSKLSVLWWCLRPWFSSSFLFCGGVSDLGSLQAFCFVVVSQTLVLSKPSVVCGSGSVLSVLESRRLLVAAFVLLEVARWVTNH